MHRRGDGNLFTNIKEKNITAILDSKELQGIRNLLHPESGQEHLQMYLVEILEINFILRKTEMETHFFSIHPHGLW